MVEYDDTNNALTLGDDDALEVGDYELRYSSGNDRYEIEHPNGEISNIPRSTSGSLVPQGFADVVSQGEVLADNGEIYTSVQTAVNNSTGFVFIGPGTFNESVNISTTGLTLEGSGYTSHITSDTSVIDVTADNVTVANIRASGSGSSNAINSSNTNTNIAFVTVDSAGKKGIGLTDSTHSLIHACRSTGTSTSAIEIGLRGIVSSCYANPGNSFNGIEVGEDAIVSNNIIEEGGTPANGILSNNNDCIIIGNRVMWSGGNTGIKTRGSDNIIANNRISGAGTNIVNSGTGTLLDGNLTGASN